MIIRYVNTDATPGGTGKTNDTTGPNRAYASLNEWEASEQQDLTAYGDNPNPSNPSAEDLGPHIVYCSGSSEDDTAVAITGWTTDSVNYIEIHVTQANRHNGFEGTGYKLTSGTTTLACYEEHIKIVGLELESTATPGPGGPSAFSMDINSGTSSLELSYCLIHGNYDGMGGIYATLYSGTTKIWNTIIYSGGNSIYNSALIEVGDTNSVDRIYNCTLADSAYDGIYINAGGTAHLKNNIVIDCDNATIVATDSTNHVCNATDDDPNLDLGRGNKENQTFSFVDYSPYTENPSAPSYNFHLASGDKGARAYGYDLSEDADLSFTDDIAGTERFGKHWDIGAFQDNTLVRVEKFVRPSGTGYGYANTDSDAWSLQEAFYNFVPGDIVNVIDTGTPYSNFLTTNTNLIVNSTQTQQVIWRGRNSDNTDFSIPRINTNWRWAIQGLNNLWQYLHFHSDSSTAGVIYFASDCGVIYRCKVTGTIDQRILDVEDSAAIECFIQKDAVGTTTGAFRLYNAGGYGCKVISSNWGVHFAVGHRRSALQNCIIIGSGIDNAVLFTNNDTTSWHNPFINNTFFNFENGIVINYMEDNTQIGLNVVLNNIFHTISGYCYTSLGEEDPNPSNQAQQQGFLMRNAMYNCGGFTDLIMDFNNEVIELTSDPFINSNPSAGEDLTLNNSAGGGALLRGTITSVAYDWTTPT